jgi:hypothetical protein
MSLEALRKGSETDASWLKAGVLEDGVVTVRDKGTGRAR